VTVVFAAEGEGYVAAAYLVFFAIVLVYVAIMARRLTRIERELRDLDSLAAKGDVAPTRSSSTETEPEAAAR
jgi:CcmD family protein